ncbi:MAG: methyltransferase [Ignavibacteriaceae bacterium]|jgi:release factor glutamine methyltransferase|nr:methyltransferase [Ignavibacteriaceae bacterium]MCW8812994.1 methyltransferase [Chlorobium sp.]MCW8995978.1 methyltransferase [Psychromonas sp.]MCW8818652.1 methyltransferase [Ignavibacteriaceae bacterium]MCW8823016.1 methyltransferase [Ignavibacteriaceae bacterium]
MNVKKKKSLIKSLAFRILYPVSEKYLSKERSYRYNDITVTVFPGVFHPGFYFSTKLLLKYLEGIDLSGKYILELGAGSGLISIYTSKRGGFVTASDISLTAFYNIEKNMKMNDANVEVVHSDLFEQVPQIRYDYIIINPPYYKKTPTSQKEFAWFGGDDFQYFRKLFSQLGNFYFENTNVIMILSDEAEIEMIKSIATEYRFLMEEIFQKKIWGEVHFIFKIKSMLNN